MDVVRTLHDVRRSYKENSTAQKASCLRLREHPECASDWFGATGFEQPALRLDAAPRQAASRYSCTIRASL